MLPTPCSLTTVSLPPEGLCTALCDRQSQAGATNPSNDGVRDAIKGFKDMRQIDVNPAVLEADSHLN